MHIMSDEEYNRLHNAVASDRRSSMSYGYNKATDNNTRMIPTMIAMCIVFAIMLGYCQPEPQVAYKDGTQATPTQPQHPSLK